jgi:methyl-accepting chemotaxis protein
LAINLQRRVQTEVRSSAEANALLVAANIGAARTAHPTILQRYVTGHFPNQENGRVIVIDPDGVLIADSTGSQNLGQKYATPRRPELMRVLQTPEPTSEIRHSQTLGQDILVAAAPIIDEATSYGAVRVSQLMGEVQDRVRRVIAGLVVIGLGALFAGLIVAFVLAGSFSRPLTKLAAVAKRLGGGDLSARAETSEGANEIVQLARSFDDMADRLEATVKAQREFVANASHLVASSRLPTRRSTASLKS